MNNRSITPREDLNWMRLALAEAKKGLGLTSPNPPVGAVIIQHLGEGENASWRLIGASYHECAGEAHAERRALLDVTERGYEKQDLLGACIYITLEPCSSWGKTPPCTDAIIEAGITRVVYACADPDKRHQGRARRLLEQQGIEVVEGVLRHDSELLLRPWFYAIQMKRPWVIAKVATSLDGRLSREATPWLSGETALQYAHELRAQSDAILIGGETLRRDQPSLTIRKPFTTPHERKKQPWRILVTKRGLNDEEKLRQPLFCDEHEKRTRVYESIEDWEAFLTELYEEYGIVQLMLESGGQLLTPLLEKGLIQEWVQILTPHLTGGPHDLIASKQYLAVEPALIEGNWLALGQDMVYRALIAPVASSRA